VNFPGENIADNGGLKQSFRVIMGISLIGVNYIQLFIFVGFQKVGAITWIGGGFARLEFNARPIILFKVSKVEIIF
jgi:hypothetical protein